MSQALYEMVKEQLDLQQAIEDTGGELTPEIEAALDKLAEKLPAKVEAVCKMIRHFDLDAVVVQAELDRLNMRKRTAVASSERLKAYLKASLEALGEKSIKTLLFTASICKNSVVSIRIEDGAEVPDQFAKVVTTVSLDREKVLEAWKTDPASVPLCIEIGQGTHLRIK